MEELLRCKEAKKITYVGFAINMVLTILKLFAGILGHSAAMLADGIHSLSDYFTDIVVLIGFKFTEKPEDENHNYGHGKYETFATLIISMALFYAGYTIFSKGIINAYRVIFLHEVLEKPGIIALIAAMVSIVCKEWLYRITRRVGESINSPAVIANGWHHRSDVYSSIGTALGIGGAILLGHEWTILDPLASIIVSIFIFKVAFQILAPSVNELIETSLVEDDLKTIKGFIEECPYVMNYHHLRTRRIGARVAIEVHMVFDEDMTIKRAHDHATNIENNIKKYFGASSIITSHLEPSSEIPYHPKTIK